MKTETQNAILAGMITIIISSLFLAMGYLIYSKPLIGAYLSTIVFSLMMMTILFIGIYAVINSLRDDF